MGAIVLSTLGTAGDVIPFVALGKALAARGHSVSVMTHAYYATMVGRAGLNHVALDTAAEFDQFVEDGPLLHSGSGVLHFLRRHILPKIPHHLTMLRELCTPDTLIVARSTPGLAERIAAELLGVPVVAVLMSPHHSKSQLLVEALLRSILSTELNNLRAALDLAPVTDWQTWWRSAAVHVGLWPAWFCAPESDWPVTPVLVGFVWHVEATAQDLPPDIQAMLQGAPPPILITGGTGAFGGREFLSAGAAACEQLALPALMIAPLPDLIPDRVPPNVRCVPFIPSLAALMPSFAAVIHHGGMGTLGTALAAGIPQIILGHGADRPDNGRYVERLGVGICLDRSQWQPEIVAQSVSYLMRGPAVSQRCRRIAQQCRQHEALESACEVIEAHLRPGKQGSKRLSEKGEAEGAAPSNPLFSQNCKAPRNLV